MSIVRNFFANTFQLPQEAAPDVATLGSICAEGLKTWQQEALSAIESTLFFPLVLQYHPRLIAAAYLLWVVDTMKQNGQALKVPEEVGQHAWFLYVDPNIEANDLAEVQAVINKELNYITGQKAE